MNRKRCCEVERKCSAQDITKLCHENRCALLLLSMYGEFSQDLKRCLLWPQRFLSYSSTFHLWEQIMVFFFVGFPPPMFSFGFLAASHGPSTGSRSSASPTTASFLQHCHGGCKVLRGALEVMGWAEGCQLLLNVRSTRVTRKVWKKVRVFFKSIILSFSLLVLCQVLVLL